MLYLIFTVLAVITRLMPHPANVAPIGALALFVGATALNQKGTFNKSAAFIVPLLAMLASDAIIGFYSWPVMLSVYLGFAISIGLGLIVRRFYRWEMIVGATLLGSVIFFLLTNAAVWAFTPMYAKTVSGLVESYIAALPFFRNSLLGDLVYSGVLFGVYDLALRPQTKTTLATI